MVIDYNRGVEIHIHPASEMRVYMYVDTPGVFLNAHGSVVADSLAAEAGFDVGALSKERERRKRMERAREVIDQELGIIGPNAVVLDRDGYQIMDVGNGRFNVRDPEGNQMNAAPLPESVAQRLLDALAPAPVAEAPGAKPHQTDSAIKRLFGGKAAPVDMDVEVVES